jgi:carbamoyl-phosphate synthase small subunit
VSDLIAKVALEDGSVFAGEAVGAPGISEGEVVFNTSLSGYQEIFTDASYNGQIVLMTSPLIGNYGINIEDTESTRPFLKGVIVRELSRVPSNFRSQGDLGSYLREQGVVGISGVDTRAITKRLRNTGSLKGVVASGEPNDADLADSTLIDRARAWEGLAGRDMVSEVTCSEIQRWESGFTSSFSAANATVFGKHGKARAAEGLRVVAYDFGIKHNILRILYEIGFEVYVVPAHTTASEVRALEPHGLFLSNGPGDPEGVDYAVREIVPLLEENYPTFGICLGHQLTALALGARTYKLKFGHHGGNHPVKNLATGKVDISVQNHCYAVDVDSLPKELEPTFINLNDKSLEGLRHKELPIFTVQFHPEAAPGPNDFTFLFEEFSMLVRQHAGSVHR